MNFNVRIFSYDKVVIVGFLIIVARICNLATGDRHNVLDINEKGIQG
jgi:hypothetical protein